jgi:hypothetical protein
MQAGHRLWHRFRGLFRDALIRVVPSLRIRVHGALLPRTAGRPISQPGLSARVEDRLAVHRPERSFS